MSLCVVDVVCCRLFPLCAFATTEWWFKFDGLTQRRGIVCSQTSLTLVCGGGVAGAHS
jgi:hypothetical protein